MELWQRNLYVMCAANLIIMLALTLIMPFLPLFLYEEIGLRSMEAVQVWTGILLSANFLMAAIFSPVWGALADRYGPRVMVIRSAMSIGLFNGLMSFTTNVYQILAIRSIMGMLTGFGAASTMLVGSGTPKERLGYALGLVQTGFMAGTIFGPFVGGALAQFLSYRAIFRITAVLCFVATLMVGALVREEAPHLPSERRGGAFSSIRQVAFHKGLAPMFLTLLLAQIALRGIDPLVPVFIKKLSGDTPYLSLIVGSIYATAGLGNLLGAPVLGKSSDALGYRRILQLSLVGAALFTIPQALVTASWHIVFPRLLVGAFVGGILPSANALIGHIAPADKRSSAYGMTSSAIFLGNFLGPLSSGLLSAALGIRPIFIITAFLLLVNAAWVGLSVEEVRPLNSGAGRVKKYPA